MRHSLLWCLLGVLCLLANGAPPRQASAQKPRGAAERGEFEFRALLVGKTYHVVRFKPRSGEVWGLNRDRWQKTKEGGALPAGDYDVVLLANEQALVAVR